jgi:signal transduction histidine kinase
MLLFRPFIQRFQRVRKRLAFDSLQVSLTAGVVAVMAVGFSGAALWTSWKMKQILVNTHKQNVQYITRRFPQDVLHYSEEESAIAQLSRQAIAGVQPAIESLSTDQVWLWLENSEGEIIAQSTALSNRTDLLRQQLQTLSPTQFIPQTQELNGRYVVFCSSPLVVKGTRLGTLFVAQDITNDQVVLMQLERSLALAGILALVGISIGVSVYIRRSLMPLRRMSQLAGEITPDNLTSARLQLQSAPKEVRELAQSCNEILLHLSHTWEQQRQLVANVSHELRTPLTIVQGYIESLLRRGDNLTTAQREALTIAASEAKRTIQLLQDLIDLARAERGKIYLHIEPFILNDLVSEVVEMSQQVSQREIELKLPPQLVEVETDRDRAKQVLINLIDNALKYSPDTEPITVAVIPEQEKVMIEVRDQGRGIALRHQARIFERFYRVDEARTRSGGSGLGLAIVKTFLEQMGGEITLRSQPHQGSTFIVTLPIIHTKSRNK